jgi:hypothetical protein
MFGHVRQRNSLGDFLLWELKFSFSRELSIMAQGPTSAPQSIPPFDQSGVLPPYKSAAATDITGMSPYRATLDEFVIRYATTPERINMLRGLFQYRAALHGYVPT